MSRLHIDRTIYPSRNLSIGDWVLAEIPDKGFGDNYEEGRATDQFTMDEECERCGQEHPVWKVEFGSGSLYLWECRLQHIR